MQWQHINFRLKKNQNARLTKIMTATFFWDQNVILLINFWILGQSINADSYYKTLQKLSQAI